MITSQVRTVLVALGAGLLVVGLIVGFLPVSASGVDCGNGWVENADAIATAEISSAMRADALGVPMSMFDLDAVQSACDSARQPRTLAAWVLAGVGIAVAGAGAFVRTERTG